MTRSRIQPFLSSAGRMDATQAASSCEALTDAIRNIYAQDIEKLNFELLYRCAYNLVLYKHGELLYSEVEKAMAAEVEGLGKSLGDVQDGGSAFLEELLSKWRRHTESATAVRDMLMYMDRTFVVSNRKVPFKELGVKLWRDGVVCSGDVLPRLVEAVRHEQADGESGSGDLMAGVAKMLKELGGDVYCQVMNASSVDE